MTNINLNDLNVGDAIPGFTTKAISRTALALFAGASGDHNPIHIDIDFAKKAGMDDVFCHGMLGMAYMSRLISDIATPDKIKTFGTRFSSITQIHAKLTCEGQVVEKITDDGDDCVRLDLIVKDENDDIKLKGYAVVAL